MTLTCSPRFHVIDASILNLIPEKSDVRRQNLLNFIQLELSFMELFRLLMSFLFPAKQDQSEPEMLFFAIFSRTYQL